ncbi:hypothetical protein L195_g011461 [Trifolium pratense]|uniref:Uncharacterized protein n=1 Tax=Trifolium pratense TaxID=57577 RepID=A0A2K3PHQ2_TRIPR|nr:hypothetical protein L195_g011461 [Trifolium pratense]
MHQFNDSFSIEIAKKMESHICMVAAMHDWIPGQLDSGIVITEIDGSFLCSYPSFSKILLNQTPRQAQDAAAMNSASVAVIVPLAASWKTVKWILTQA